MARLKVGDLVILVKINHHFTRHDRPHLKKMMKRPHLIHAIHRWVGPGSGPVYHAELQSYVDDPKRGRIYHSFWIESTELRKVTKSYDFSKAKRNPYAERVNG